MKTHLCGQSHKQDYYRDTFNTLHSFGKLSKVTYSKSICHLPQQYYFEESGLSSPCSGPFSSVNYDWDCCLKAMAQLI